MMENGTERRIFAYVERKLMTSPIYTTILPNEVGWHTMNFNGKNYQVHHKRKIVNPLEASFDDSWRIHVNDDLTMSVIRRPGSYGYKAGLFEIAFIDPNPAEFTFSDIFTGEWGDDVLGFLTEEEALEWLTKAEEL